MIQRIQTVYLLLSMACAILLYFVPVWQSAAVLIDEGMNVIGAGTHLLLLPVPVLMVISHLLSIFTYKKGHIGIKSDIFTMLYRRNVIRISFLIFSFFILEKYALWRHAHASGDSDMHQGGQQCDDHTHSHHHLHGAAGSQGETLSILVGDGFHNFTDGLLIAAAFLADPALGWGTTLAIIAHEVPQEAGDFAILLAAGWKRGRALLWNGVSSLTAVAGGIIGYFAFDHARDWIPYIITITAASFLYIAIADLMPRLKRETQAVGWHGVLLAAGIAVVVLGSSHSH